VFLAHRERGSAAPRPDLHQAPAAPAGRAGAPCGPRPRTSRLSRPRFARSGDDGVGWEAGGMPDAVPPVNLASLAAGGSHPGTRWRLDGEDLQANLIRLGPGGRIQPHRDDEVEVLVVVVSGRGELTVDGQVHQLAPMVVAHLPKGAVRAIEVVDGPLAYLSVHRRRQGGLQVGRPAQ
jgi:quercetin dioxygenase-like cupin family protein